MLLQKDMRKKIAIFFGIFLLVLLISSVFSYFSEGIIHSLIHSDTSKLLSFFSSLGLFASVVIFLLIIIENVVAPLPPLILYLVAGLSFGGFWGGLLSLAGNVVGSAIAFFLAKSLGRKWVEKKVSLKIRQRFDKFSQKYGGISIFLLRVNPLTSTDLFSYLGGLSKIRFRIFIIATTLGLAPTIFVQTYLGEIFRTNTLLFNLFIFSSIFYFLAFIFLYFYFKKKNKK